MPKWHIWGWQILLPFSYLNNKRYLLEGSGKHPEFKWNTQASECTGTMVVFRKRKSQTMSLGLISKLPVRQHWALCLAVPLRLQGIRQGLGASADERGCFCPHWGELRKKECFQATCLSSFLGVTAKRSWICVAPHLPPLLVRKKPWADSHSGGFPERTSVTEDCGFLLPPGPSYPLSCQRRLGAERSEKRKSTLHWRVLSP